MKKYLALAIVAVLVFSFGFPLFAVEEKPPEVPLPEKPLPTPLPTPILKLSHSDYVKLTQSYNHFKRAAANYLENFLGAKNPHGQGQWFGPLTAAINTAKGIDIKGLDRYLADFMKYLEYGNVKYKEFMKKREIIEKRYRDLLRRKK